MKQVPGQNAVCACLNKNLHESKAFTLIEVLANCWFITLQCVPLVYLGFDTTLASLLAPPSPHFSLLAFPSPRTSFMPENQYRNQYRNRKPCYDIGALTTMLVAEVVTKWYSASAE